jgi:hypothetical protein
MLSFGGPSNRYAMAWRLGEWEPVIQRLPAASARIRMVYGRSVAKRLGMSGRLSVSGSFWTGFGAGCGVVVVVAVVRVLGSVSLTSLRYRCVNVEVSNVVPWRSLVGFLEAARTLSA